jgi:PAS domain S-box-containing protein
MKKDRWYLYIIEICLILSVSSSGRLLTPIRIGSYDNPPKISLSENGEMVGFWPSILKQIASQENWEIIWIHCNWDECLQKLENNEIDIMPDVGWSTVREQKYLFTKEPVLISWARVYVRQGSEIQTILDLNGKRVAGLKGSLNFDGPEGMKAISKQFGVEITFVDLASYDEVLQAVQNQQVDAGITNKDFGDQNERKYGVVRTPIIIQPTQIMFALPRNGAQSSEIAAVLDKDIKSYKADRNSVYYLALDQYLGIESAATNEKIPQWLATVLVIFGGGIVILVLVILIIRNQVATRTKQLSQSEARYRALVSNLPDMIFRMDSDGTFLDYHSSMEQALYSQPEIFLNKKAVEVLPEGLADELMKYMKKAITTNEVQLHEYQLLLGEVTHYFEARYKASSNQEVTIVIRDISDRKKAEAELQQSEQRYQTLARVSPVGIFYADAQGSTTYVNPTWCDIAGIQAKDALGDGWLKGIHPDDKEELYSNWMIAAQKHTSSVADYRFVHQDGSITWVVGQAVPETNTAGEVVGYVGSITNITDRKKMELALQASIQSEREALRVSKVIQNASFTLSQTLDLEKIIHTLMDNLALIVPYDHICVLFIKNSETILVSTIKNQITGEITNPVASELRIHSFPILERIVTEKSSFVISDTTMEKLWTDPSPLPAGKSWMGVPIIAGGQIIGILTLSTIREQPFSDGCKEFTEALAAQAALAIQNAKLHDQLVEHAHQLELRVAERTAELANRVDEVERLNQSMAELMRDIQLALQKAESADRLKSAFLATMSHELRTPLNSIIGFSGILLQKLVGPLLPEQEKQLRMVQNSAQHLLEMINDILDISKIEADQMVIGTDEFQVDVAVSRCIERVTPMAQKKNLDLVYHVQPESIQILNDRRRFEQILLNLLNNAIKFTETGKIELSCIVDGSWLITSVTDTGIGISPEDQATLFTPFRQIDTGISRQYEGTGLGLSICKRLVDLMGGKITVESQLGVGSKFEFYIPFPKRTS